MRWVRGWAEGWLCPPNLAPPEPWVPQVLQDNVASPSHPFLSFKRVLWEMGAPLASTVQLVSFYPLSKCFGG